MDNQPTPGPWIVDTQDRLGTFVKAEADQGGSLAYVYARVGSETEAANARLIAAAPTQKAALLDALAEIRFWHDLNSSEEMKETDWIAYCKLPRIQRIITAIALT